MKYIPGILLILLFLSLPRFVWAEDEATAGSNGKTPTTQTDTDDKQKKDKQKKGGDEEEEEEPDCE